MIRVEDNRKGKANPLFGELSCGEVFQYYTGVFMKIRLIEEYNAVDLATGELWKIGRESQVRRLNVVRLIIED